MNKDVVKELNRLEHEGFVVERTGGRVTIIAPNGQRSAPMANFKAVRKWASRATSQPRRVEKERVGGEKASRQHDIDRTRRMNAVLTHYEKLPNTERKLECIREMLARLSKDDPRAGEALGKLGG